VWAADLYSSAFVPESLSSAARRRYRELVLEPGAGVSEAGTLREFLGRNPSSEAYYAELAKGVEHGLCYAVAFHEKGGFIRKRSCSATYRT
jgi:hypothetical protein